MKKEFIVGRGLDNLACCFCALEGFLNASNLEEEENIRFLLFSRVIIRMMVLYDNEEVGSRSLMGADGTLLSDVFSALNSTSDADRISRRKSLLLSCVRSMDSNHP